MQIIEDEIELQRVLISLKAGASFWIPIYSDPFQHYMNNRISFIYIYSIAEDPLFVSQDSRKVSIASIPMGIYQVFF